MSSNSVALVTALALAGCGGNSCREPGLEQGRASFTAAIDGIVRPVDMDELRDGASQLPDFSIPDLSTSSDMAVQPDLTDPEDLTPQPDLALTNWYRKHVAPCTSDRDALEQVSLLGNMAADQQVCEPLLPYQVCYIEAARSVLDLGNKVNRLKVANNQDPIVPPAYFMNPSKVLMENGAGDNGLRFQCAEDTNGAKVCTFAHINDGSFTDFDSVDLVAKDGGPNQGDTAEVIVNKTPGKNPDEVDGTISALPKANGEIVSNLLGGIHPTGSRDCSGFPGYKTAPKDNRGLIEKLAADAATF